VKTVLVFLSALYTLRGLVLILDLVALTRVHDYPLRAALFSGVSLSIGLAHSIGTIRAWPRLHRNAAASTGDAVV
jgi:hypothetical protein